MSCVVGRRIVTKIPDVFSTLEIQTTHEHFLILSILDTKKCVLVCAPALDTFEYFLQGLSAIRREQTLKIISWREQHGIQVYCRYEGDRHFWQQGKQHGMRTSVGIEFFKIQI